MTPRQLEALALVFGHLAAHGCPPSLEEVGHRLGLTKRGAHYLLQRLVASGHLSRPMGRARYWLLTAKGRRALGVVPCRECGAMREVAP